MSKVKFGVVVFPGSNCDHDAYHAVKHVLGSQAEFLWHKEGNLADADVIILPGGFSYGDYLRCGAISRFSPIMKEVVRHAGRGGHVIGICNGFQILTESGLLPGALLRNRSLDFVCKQVHLRVEQTGSAFTNRYAPG
jgi:phosphoribosylformylglycinamidine synthase